MDRDLVVLASASPRRLQLLTGLGLRVEVRPSHVDETAEARESPVEQVARLAVAKAARAVSSLAGAGRGPMVLAADTEVVVDGAILGKPADEADARRMLRRLAGRGHDVLTGVRLVDVATGRSDSRVVTSRVVFRELDEERLRWYAASGEPRDKAGAYAIQGLGVFLIERLEGSWSNVVGLPLEALPDMFEEVGVDLWAMLRRGRSASPWRSHEAE